MIEYFTVLCNLENYIKISKFQKDRTTLNIDLSNSAEDRNFLMVSMRNLTNEDKTYLSLTCNAKFHKDLDTMNKFVKWMK